MAAKVPELMTKRYACNEIESHHALAHVGGKRAR